MSEKGALHLPVHSTALGKFQVLAHVALVLEGRLVEVGRLVAEALAEVGHREAALVVRLGYVHRHGEVLCGYRRLRKLGIIWNSGENWLGYLDKNWLLFARGRKLLALKVLGHDVGWLAASRMSTLSALDRRGRTGTCRRACSCLSRSCCRGPSCTCPSCSAGLSRRARICTYLPACKSLRSLDDTFQIVLTKLGLRKVGLLPNFIHSMSKIAFVAFEAASLG